jgi:tetratricopeptide (TPR) repeat protein
MIPLPKARKCFEEGRKLCEAGQYDDAIFLFNDALSNQSNYANVWNYKGYAFYKLKKYDKALECFDKAIEIKPQYLKAWINKGKTCYHLGKFEHSIDCFNYITAIRPEFANAWNYKGLVLKKDGKLEDALECFEEAIKINENYAQLWKKKGEEFLTCGQTGLANDCLQIVKTTLACNSNPLIQISEILCETGQFQRAIECIETATKLKPQNAKIFNKKEKILKKYSGEIGNLY